MKVFAQFDPDKPNELARLWVKTWRENGWTPKILMPGETLAQRRGRGKCRMSNLSEINLGLKPGDRRSCLNVRTMPPGATEDDYFRPAAS